MKTNITTLINEIQKDVEPFDVFVPSLDKKVQFKPLTIQQQKGIIKHTLDGVSGNIEIPKKFNDIILQNSVEPHNYYLYDRNAILTQLRINTIGCEVYDTNDEKATLDFKERKFSLNNTSTITLNNISVDVEVPTLAKDSAYFTDLSNKTYDKPSDLFNDMYVYEIAKFIKSITYKDTTISPNIDESINLVNELPLALNNKISLFIQQIKKYDDEYLKTKEGTTCQIDVKFFNIPI